MEEITKVVAQIIASNPIEEESQSDISEFIGRYVKVCAPPDSKGSLLVELEGKEIFLNESEYELYDLEEGDTVERFLKEQ